MNIMLVTKQIEIDMSHRVFQHKSKCFSPHGHRYFIEVGVDDKIIDIKGDSSEGMVIDFSDLKEIMMLVLDKNYDHGVVISDKDYIFKYCLVDSLKLLEDEEVCNIIKNKIPKFKELLEQYNKDKKRHWKINIINSIPTAENLAKHWFFLINLELLEKGISLKYIKVWETPTSTAIYTSDDARKETDKNQKTLQQYPMKKW